MMLDTLMWYVAKVPVEQWGGWHRMLMWGNLALGTVLIIVVFRGLFTMKPRNK